MEKFFIEKQNFRGHEFFSMYWEVLNKYIGKGSYIVLIVFLLKLHSVICSFQF